MTNPSAVAHSSGFTPHRSAAAPISMARAKAAVSRSGCSKARTEVEPAVMRIRPLCSIKCARNALNPSSQPTSDASALP
jgi:hypothetical protein